MTALSAKERVMTDKPEAATDATAPSFKSMLDTATQIWLAGLGAIWLNPFFKAQDEGAKMLDLLVKQGGRLQKHVGAKAETVEHDHRAATWERLEQVFDDRVGRALTRLNVPTQADMDALHAKIETLTAALEAVSKQPGNAAKHAPIPRTPAPHTPAKPRAG
jgi:poly(hydroxyalkanoate) granule-associated protein